jgi:hypothetical protein
MPQFSPSKNESSESSQFIWISWNVSRDEVSTIDIVHLIENMENDDPMFLMSTLNYKNPKSSKDASSVMKKGK